MPSHVKSEDIDTNQNSSVSSSFFFTQSNLPLYIHPNRTKITHRPSRRYAQVQTYHTFRLQPNEPYTGFIKIGLWPALIGTESFTPTPPPAHSKLIEWKLSHIDRMEKCVGPIKSYTGRRVQADVLLRFSKNIGETLVNSITLTLGVCVRKSVFPWWPCVKNGAERTARIYHDTFRFCWHLQMYQKSLESLSGFLYEFLKIHLSDFENETSRAPLS